jgi:hypothetical protein
MARTNLAGEKNLPYSHQMRCAEKQANMNWGLIAHDAGLGKTATAVQLFCIIHLQSGGDATMVVTAPSACLPQWELTLHDWLSIPNKKTAIIKTSKSTGITEVVLAKCKVLITTRHCIANAYKSSYRYNKQAKKNSRGHWTGGWERIANTRLHPLFVLKNGKPRFTVMVADEAHLMRNSVTEWAISHKRLAENSQKRYGLSATPIYNRPSDMVGICTALNSDEVYQTNEHWTNDKTFKSINVQTVEEFQKYIDRVDDKILNLPKIHEKICTFSPKLEKSSAEFYNSLLSETCQLRLAVENQTSKGGKVNRDDLRRLMQKLGKLQQCLISPLLGQMGATIFKSTPSYYLKSAKENTGALQALYAEIMSLRTEGHVRIMVACCHVEPMRIAKTYLTNVAKNGDGCNFEIFVYDGDLNLDQRQAQKVGFLTTENSILFLSIGAGGTGLHLVPGCNACIFWGSRPYSPAQVWQTTKRIHRIGQTKDVFVRHLIADGSVDAAIQGVHKDKTSLSAAIVDGDWSGVGSDGTSWRKTGSIVDGCCFINSDGEFEPKKKESCGGGGSSSNHQRGPKRERSDGIIMKSAGQFTSPSIALGQNRKKQKPAPMNRWKQVVRLDATSHDFFGKKLSSSGAGSSTAAAPAAAPVHEETFQRATLKIHVNKSVLGKQSSNDASL